MNSEKPRDMGEIGPYTPHTPPSVPEQYREEVIDEKKNKKRKKQQHSSERESQTPPPVSEQYREEVIDEKKNKERREEREAEEIKKERERLDDVYDDNKTTAEQEPVTEEESQSEEQKESQKEYSFRKKAKWTVETIFMAGFGLIYHSAKFIGSLLSEKKKSVEESQSEAQEKSEKGTRLNLKNLARWTTGAALMAVFGTLYYSAEFMNFFLKKKKLNFETGYKKGKSFFPSGEKETKEEKIKKALKILKELSGEEERGDKNKQEKKGDWWAEEKK
jgi:hypothetical protein